MEELGLDPGAETPLYRSWGRGFDLRVSRKDLGLPALPSEDPPLLTFWSGGGTYNANTTAPAAGLAACWAGNVSYT